jgi:membrane protease YdiL (CAAX protease family)
VGWQAIGAQAALFTLFGLVLGVAATVDRLLVFFAFALVLGVLRTATGDIAAGIGFHWAFQTTGQLFLGEGAAFDVAGTTGPWSVRVRVRALHAGLDGRDPYLSRSHRCLEC